ncbi:hypothetical protein [Streptomyces griseus]|uniref:hypothetical protein n=1 Tax=Streptomyces griseus TaxID=1911 RepID=UPI00365F5585
MDAGLAAVCGALAGAIGAVGAAWATSNAQLKSARLAARAEHLRQRRDTRSVHYRELITAVSDLLAHLRSGQSVGRPLFRFTNDYLNDMKSLCQNVRSKVEDVALAGPPEVRNAAYRIRRAMEITFEAVDQLNANLREVELTSESEHPMEARNINDFARGRDRIGELLEDFSDEASDALDDDGTRFWE